MTKFVNVLAALVVLSGAARAQLTPLWELSDAQGTLPSYWSDANNTERGFCYGHVEGQDFVFVATRNGGVGIVYHDATTGDSLGALDMRNVEGGYFGLALMDVEVSDDGAIFACNLAGGTENFKVYRFGGTLDTARVVIDFPVSDRVGDKFHVAGSTIDNSIEIYAAGASSETVYRFTTNDNGNSFVADTLTRDNGAFGNAPKVCANDDGTMFYATSGGEAVIGYDTDFAAIDTVPTSLVAGGTSSLEYYSGWSREFLAVFAYGAGNENARIVDITTGLDNAALQYVSPSLGDNPNGNGAGDVDVWRPAPDSVIVFVMSTNNGMAAYAFEPLFKVAPVTFQPAGGVYFDTTDVVLDCATDSVTIYYTTDGTAPDSSANEYLAPIQVIDTAHIQAIAYREGWEPSEPTEAFYEVVWAEPLSKAWARTVKDGNLPAYFSPNAERGMAYGNVGGNDRVYVVAKMGGPLVVYHDAETGELLDTLTAPESLGTRPGYFKMNGVEVSDDGAIFVCNMTLDAGSDPFVVYRWDADDAAPAEVLTFSQSGARMGDMFAVSGRTDDNSLEIFAGVSGSAELIKFTTDDNGATFTPTTIALDSAVVSTTPVAAPVGDGTFYYKSYGTPLVRYDTTGALVDSVSTSVVASAATNVKYFERAGEKYILTYEADEDASGDAENLTVVNVTAGDENAFIQWFSPAIGSEANLNAAGAVDYQIVDSASGAYRFYILGSNNGVAAFTNDTTTVGVCDERIVATVPSEFSIAQNYPNPFNPSTTIEVRLADAAHVTLTVFNVLGEKAATPADGAFDAGVHRFSFDASGLAGGVYFYRMEAVGANGARYMETKKMLFLK
ncbi:MAG: DUF4623 domain-containing protein [Ignavibacteriales bacterium]|nr:DUF4623 domain-containing protein [Ignavibacteriales bacterium]